MKKLKFLIKAEYDYKADSLASLYIKLWESVPINKAIRIVHKEKIHKAETEKTCSSKGKR